MNTTFYFYKRKKIADISVVSERSKKVSQTPTHNHRGFLLIMRLSVLEKCNYKMARLRGNFECGGVTQRVNHRTNAQG